MPTISAALLPDNEHERFAFPQHYEHLSARVALSAYLFGALVSYITLAGADYLLYQASYIAALLPPVPRQQMLCMHVIEQNKIICYRDLATITQTALDAMAVQHALAQQARFYAGAPIRIPNQQAIGTLCLVGHHPRSFSAREQQVLEHLACVVSQTVTRCHHHRHTPVLSTTSWQLFCGQVLDEIRALITLVRYPLRRRGPARPIPNAALGYAALAGHPCPATRRASRI
jgi:hypothetical protein